MYMYVHVYICKLTLVLSKCLVTITGEHQHDGALRALQLQRVVWTEVLVLLIVVLIVVLIV